MEKRHLTRYCIAKRTVFACSKHSMVAHAVEQGGALLGVTCGCCVSSSCRDDIMFQTLGGFLYFQLDSKDFRAILVPMYSHFLYISGILQLLTQQWPENKQNSGLELVRRNFSFCLKQQPLAYNHNEIVQSMTTTQIERVGGSIH